MTSVWLNLASALASLMNYVARVLGRMWRETSHEEKALYQVQLHGFNQFGIER